MSTLRTRIKICGLTREQDVDAAVEAGADAVGFVLYDKSPRHVTPARAAELARRLPPFVTPVLLFVNESATKIIAACAVPVRAIAPFCAMTRVTSGLKWAPLTGPSVSISTYSANTVASVLASKATARFSPASRSAMMPEPITAQSRAAVPTSSASACLASGAVMTGRGRARGFAASACPRCRPAG